MQSAIYEGTIRHRRVAERAHEFRHRIAMAFLDLDELGEVVGGRLIRSGPGPVRFRRSDYLGDPNTPLTDAVRLLVAERLGAAPQGPVRVLTHLRSFGHCFNPVSLYYCFASGGKRLEAIVAEVTNTPWGERHAYVLPCGLNGPGSTMAGGSFKKVLHVSPFLGMDQLYVWRAVPPGQTLWVHIQNIEAGRRVFEATLSLHRRPLDRRTLASITVRYPAATVGTVGLIYWHASVLKLKGVSVKPHPGTRQS